MALCNVKGRVVASGWAIAVSDNETVGVALVVHRTVDSALRRFLKPYVTFSNCQMLDDPWPVQIKHQGSGGTLEAAPGYNLLVAASAPSTAVDQGLVNKFETALIEQRFAFVDDAVTGQFLPQMLALDDSRAVDFDKGCYLGQEIVARAQFRGQVKRQLDTFEWHGERPSPGDTWADRGTVIQTVQTNGEGANRGIGHAVLPV